MPSLFLCHGAPLVAVEQNGYTEFLRNLPQQMGRPDAVLLFTAHWESETLTLSSRDDEYETIHDFGGFPEELYTIRYPAKGSVQWAGEIRHALEFHGIPVNTDQVRGLDHGAWVLLRHLFPDADVPVIQASVNPWLPPDRQYEIGQAIRPLAEQGLWIIGSGASVHNLRLLNWDDGNPEDWAVQFDDWLISRLRDRDLESLFRYAELAPSASLAVPRPEHFVPLFIALGAGSLPEPRVIHRSYRYGTLSHLCLEF
jgi:4,5-DOPA dioxygenase extradiol